MNQEMTDRVAQLVAAYSDRRPIAEILCDRHAADQTAFRFVDADCNAQVVTFGELRTLSSNLARGFLKAGIKPGDRIAALMDKGPDLIAVLLAIWRVGAVYVPLFTAFAYPALAMRLSGSNAKAIVFDPHYFGKLSSETGEGIADSGVMLIASGGSIPGVCTLADLISDGEDGEAPGPSMGPDGEVIHIFTSGTTGKPKGVVIPKKAFAAFHAYGEFALDLRTEDVFWNAADPGWAYGLYLGVVLPMLMGVSQIMLKTGFSARITADVLRQFGVTNFAAAPTVYRGLMMLDTPIQCRLRCASSAGEPLTPDVNVWALGAIGVQVHDHYGQTEAGMIINNHHHPRLRGALKQGSMGRLMPGWSASVFAHDAMTPLDDGCFGRLALNLKESPLAWFSGYSDQQDTQGGKITADGVWYFTGDIAMRDAEGDYFFSARDDDVIIMAGYRIGPFEVESILNAHSAVLESAVIAAPDQLKGEVVEAYVVLQKGVTPDAALAEDLQRWVKSRYAAHAYPRAIHFEERLPKTPSGKIQRAELRRMRRENKAN